MSSEQDSNQRQHERLLLNLPIQAQVGQGEYQDMEVVDISPSGMQIRSESFDVLNRGFDTQQNQAEFEIRISAHLAWVQNSSTGDFLTGWEFDRGEGPSTRKAETDAAEEKRRHARLEINLPIEAQVGEGNFQEMDVVDISPSGMQLRVKEIDPVEGGADARHMRMVFDIRIEARLAWVQTGNKDEFLTGWEFDVDTGEARIG